jgi:alpha-L-fucosidase
MSRRGLLPGVLFTSVALEMLRLGLPAPARGAEPASPSPNAVARTWLEDSKLGLFVHWGVSALVGKGEWVMEQDRLPISEYEKLPPRFNPTEFDAQRWVKTAKEAGQKFLVITAKGHDGFALFDTAAGRYDVVDATPYAKDPLRDLAEACRQHEIRLFLYYSLLDWHHPDYYPRGQTGRHAGREDRGDWSRYVAYYQGQVRELCTNYGAIGGIVFDGAWDRPEADWDLERTFQMVHELQPGALVAHHHPGPPRAGEDFQIVDRDREPGADQPGGGGRDEAAPAPAPALPRVVSLTLSGSPAAGGDPRNPASLVHELLGAAGVGASLLVDVAARPDGTLGGEVVNRLVDAGKWLDRFGPTVYGTRRGPVAPQPWGVSVSKPRSGAEPGAVYLHVLKPEVPVRLPRALGVFDAWLEGKSDRLNVLALGNDLILNVPEKDRLPIDTIIVLRPKGYER